MRFPQILKIIAKLKARPKASVFKGISEGVSFYLFIQIHSMDFDDTWHPATHPSGAVLPVLTALSEALPQTPKFSGLDLLLAFSVGIEVQGRLLHFSKEAKDIPKRYREPEPIKKRHTFPCLSVAVCEELWATLPPACQ